jgi:hypothetical protein
MKRRAVEERKQQEAENKRMAEEERKRKEESETASEGLARTPVGFVGQTQRGPTHPILITNWSEYKQIFGTEIEPSISFLPLSIRGFFENGGGVTYILRVVSENAQKAKLKLETADEQQFLVIESLNPGAWGNNIFISVQAGARRGFRLTFRYYNPLHLNNTNVHEDTILNKVDPEIEEDYDNLDYDPNGQKYVLRETEKSELVALNWYAHHRDPARPLDLELQLSGGSDGSPINVTRYIDENNTEKLAYVDAIAILCIPDQVHPSFDEAEQMQILHAMINQCECLKDRIAILSIAASHDIVSNINKYRDSSILRDTRYAAIYYPWIRVYDPYTNSNILIPAVGHVAGIFVRNDMENGIHKAPIDQEVRGVISSKSNQSPLELDVTLEQQDIINRLGINTIRNLDKEGNNVRLVTGMTMSIADQWQDIGVSRFINFIGKSISMGLQWTKLVPNDEFVWSKVINLITEFMTKIWEEGALLGNNAEEAFFVKCDKSTMTQNDIDNGRLIILIGLSLINAQTVIITLELESLLFGLKGILHSIKNNIDQWYKDEDIVDEKERNDMKRERDNIKSQLHTIESQLELETPDSSVIQESLMKLGNRSPIYPEFQEFYLRFVQREYRLTVQSKDLIKGNTIRLLSKGTKRRYRSENLLSTPGIRRFFVYGSDISFW